LRNAPIASIASSSVRTESSRASGRLQKLFAPPTVGAWEQSRRIGENMPEVYVHAIKGRSPEQKRALIKDISDAVVKHFNVPIDAVMVEIVESEPANKAKGGVLFSERR